jgi:hypothetical protein
VALDEKALVNDNAFISGLRAIQVIVNDDGDPVSEECEVVLRPAGVGTSHLAGSAGLRATRTARLTDCTVVTSIIGTDLVVRTAIAAMSRSTELVAAGEIVQVTFRLDLTHAVPVV